MKPSTNTADLRQNNNSGCLNAIFRQPEFDLTHKKCDNPPQFKHTNSRVQRG
ncbi:hypothetical protein [Alysiella filiformis]|uniref:hypothetical protein n=1 Tax=Alysiella filiformis TaxID=194196 RepID=UPI0015C7C85E|nr:hypothetical protein [Alysiella filiformis]QMT32042.1 hypothetical protein H3L97_03995 [Alysiella filiformis]UBQ57049.1 hypothetical protein JF568_04680 [Alysiella filiformis DSM 16848]